MKEVISYALVVDSSSADFVRECNSMIKLGYQPYGKLIVDGSPKKLIQAFVKFKT